MENNSEHKQLLSNMVFRKEKKMLPSQSDSFGRLSIPACFDLFMDIAAEHQELLSSGIFELARTNKYWVVAKTRIILFERPNLLEKMIINTWCETPKNSSQNRGYSIKQESKVLVSGVTQWVVIDSKTGRPCKIKDIYPEEINFPENMKMTESFVKMPKDLVWHLFGEHIVQSSDIDFAKHMNNVAYIRAIQNLFSIEEWEKLNIQMFEIHYKKPCLEGEQIHFYLAKQEAVLYIKGENNHDIVIEAVLKC